RESGAPVYSQDILTSGPTQRVGPVLFSPLDVPQKRPAMPRTRTLLAYGGNMGLRAIPLMLRESIPWVLCVERTHHPIPRHLRRDRGEHDSWNEPVPSDDRLLRILRRCPQGSVEPHLPVLRMLEQFPYPRMHSMPHGRRDPLCINARRTYERHRRAHVPCRTFFLKTCEERLALLLGEFLRVVQSRERSEDIVPLGY